MYKVKRHLKRPQKAKEVKRYMATKKIRVDFVRLVGKSKSTGKSYDFLVARGSDGNGKKCDFKFTRAVDNLPKEEGKYVMSVESNNINKDRSSIYNQYWIKKVEKFEKYEIKNTEEELPF